MYSCNLPCSHIFSISVLPEIKFIFKNLTQNETISNFLATVWQNAMSKTSMQCQELCMYLHTHPWEMAVVEDGGCELE